MANENKITPKKIAHDIAAQYVAGILLKVPQEMPNIARLYLDTYHNVLEQLQPKNSSTNVKSLPNFPTVPSYWSQC